MGFKLKRNRPSFAMTDGEFAGRNYKHNMTYKKVPEEHADWFAPVGGTGAVPEPAQHPPSPEHVTVPVPRPQVEPPVETPNLGVSNKPGKKGGKET